MKSFLLAVLLLVFLPRALGEKRLVLVDQDGSGPGGSNQMSMMVLLQSPDADVLGIEGPDEITPIRRTTLRLFGMVVTSSVPSMSFNVRESPRFALYLQASSPAHPKSRRR
jgi:hypothetical protein